MTKPYYAEGGITIYHGDCRDILPQLEPVDLVLTDPPFEQEAHTLQRRINRGKTRGGNADIITAEPLPFSPITDELRSDVSLLIGKLCKRWSLIFCQIEAVPKWRKCLEDAELSYKRTCIWVKPDGMPQFSGDRPGMGYETILAVHGPGRSKWNGGGRHGVFVVNKGENGGKKNPHPTTKPLALMATLVDLFSNSGETILDPFMGSGTTLVAARDLGRKAIGIEMEEKYCEIAVQRLRKNKDVLALGD